MKTQDLQSIAEQLYPYSFGAEKRVVDGKRSAFVAGVKHRETKTFFDVHTIPDEGVEEIVRLINDLGKTHKLVSRVKYKGHFIACLTNDNEKLYFSIYDDGNFELHRGEMYITAQQLELNTKAVFEAYKYLTEVLNYEIK